MIVVEQQYTHFLNNLHENIWLVDKEGYEKCEVNTKKVQKKIHRSLGVCNTPSKLSYHTLAFEMFNLHQSGMFQIKKGGTYYLISKYWLFPCMSWYTYEGLWGKGVGVGDGWKEEEDKKEKWEGIEGEV